MTRHLNECAAYRATKQSNPRERLSFKQQPIKVQQLSKEQVELREREAGYAIYCGARPFSTFAEPYMNRFISNLAPAFKIPDRNTFAGRILDLCYIETKAQVEEILKHARVINVIINELSNINRNRIINLCIHVPLGPFCIKYEAVPTGTWSAQHQAKWLNKQLIILEESISHKFPPV